MFIRLLQGVGTGPIMAASIPIAAADFPPNERSIATDTQGFSVGFGFVIFRSSISQMHQSPVQN